MIETRDFTNPRSLAIHLSKYVTCPSTIVAGTANHFGKDRAISPREAVELVQAERKARERAKQLAEHKSCDSDKNDGEDFRPRGLVRVAKRSKADTEREARNQRLAEDYKNGVPKEELAGKYKLARRSVNFILHKMGACLDESEWKARLSAAGKKSKRGSGVWPDCPEHLKAEYLYLKRNKRIPAAEARAILEASQRGR